MSFDSRTARLVLLLLVLCLGTFSALRGKAAPDLGHIPILGKELGRLGRKREFVNNAKAFLARGYEEYNKKGQPFQVETALETMVVLNSKQATEVASMPDEVVDNMRPNGRALMDKYTGYLDADDTIYRIIKTKLTTRLGDFGDALADQTERCLANDLPECKDWTHVDVYNKLTHIVASVSTRIFVGEELCEDEEWLDATIDYTTQLVTAATILQHIPSFLRGAVYWMIPAFRKLMQINKTATRLIKPVVEARREAMDKPDHVPGDNAMEWMLEERKKKAFHDKDYERAAQYQLQMSFAATHTTSMALTNMLFDLVAYPETIDMLREEIKEQLMDNNGSYGGTFLKKLPKIDSFMKESQRRNPVGFTIVGRDVLQNVTLSDGTFLPRGTHIAANVFQIVHDQELLQSDSDPKSFDALRYYDLRKKMMRNGADDKEVAGKHQFVSVSNTSLMFGFGKHACPGRFFAGNEIKLILTKLLMCFDLKLPPGEWERYAGKSHGTSNYIDAKKTILMKRLTG